MRCNLFKLSAVTATILASFGANAALYNVYHYAPVVDDSAKTFGVAIQPSAVDCWSDSAPGIDCSASHTSDQKIAFEEQKYNQGFDYRDEAPFRYSHGFEYLQKGKQGFENYCSNFLRYGQTACNRWVAEQYDNGYAKESSSFNNSYAYIEATGVNTGNNNVIVNSFLNNETNALGTYYGGDLEDRTVAYGESLTYTGYTQSKIWVKEGTFTVGSVSKKMGSQEDYESKAAIWNGSTLTTFDNATGLSGRSVPQGSARDIATVGTTVYAVGYSSDSDQRPVASVFKTDGSKDKVLVSSYSDDKYLNSLFTHINNNGIAIGERKYNQDIGGSWANKLFYATVTENLPNPNPGLDPDPVISVNEFSGSIFFPSANGKAGAINNNNEVVGQIDYQKHNEIGGSPRAKRAFITVLGSNAATNPQFKGGSYFLDDLTMGSNATENNNQYRVIDATDINDAGVISGTAYFCDGGYDSQASNATCQGGTQGVEKIVAVKLVPINGAKAENIQPRPVDVTTIERQGGSLGWLALGLLALLGFRRKQ